ncbi:DUF397 domain-containing protein [Streptomyces sp. BBFR2]|uniref:DUF397 domain-containing protein n=1 Tax=Streptomyces sp. BBFR2 TaxID=3372854 RepID=UPI0037DA49E4
MQLHNRNDAGSHRRKSGHREAGGAERVRAAEDFAGTARWRKSSHSDAGGDCVEILEDFPGIVPVRDSKVPGGPALVVGTGAWGRFVTAVKGGTLTV